MKNSITLKRIYDSPTWEETSGFLNFLSLVPRMVADFEERMGFGLEYAEKLPIEIDGYKELAGKFGFLMLRHNRILPDRTYCLYSLYHHRQLFGFIGTYSENGTIKTLKELHLIEEFGNRAKVELYDWLRELVRSSCNKL